MHPQGAAGAGRERRDRAGPARGGPGNVAVRAEAEHAPTGPVVAHDEAVAPDREPQDLAYARELEPAQFRSGGAERDDAPLVRDVNQGAVLALTGRDRGRLLEGACSPGE